MDNKTRLIEAEVAVCFIAMAIVAFTLMLVHGLWLTLARRWQYFPGTFLFAGNPDQKISGYEYAQNQRRLEPYPAIHGRMT
jgi:hypothetical protein